MSSLADHLNIPTPAYSTNPWRFLLQTYLRNALCPAPTSMGVPLRERPQDRNWKCVDYREAMLQSEAGSMIEPTLVDVRELDIWDFRTAVRKYIDETPDIFITEVVKPLMTIPCYDVTVATPEQIDFLSRVNDQNDFLLLIMTFILGPVTESCRMINNIPRGAPMAYTLQFIATRSPQEYPILDYDVLRIPTASHGLKGYLNIICIPPWKIGHEDLRAFAMPSKIPKKFRKFDRYQDVSEASMAKADDLWRVVSNVCEGPCFIVTNYLFWCFGRLESEVKMTNYDNYGKGKDKAVDDYAEGRATAVVSQPIELEMSVPNGIRLPMMTRPMGLGCTVPECLLFWIQMVRGAAPWLRSEPLPSDESDDMDDDDDMDDGDNMEDGDDDGGDEDYCNDG
ncbi:hypothetical protein GYMLUDRAFT_100573 [Collybiopsis luxurians FD-317 M1]|uniref:Unplaced genomic scaffold GYMLUscaffold_88, whole genome shotgun sequence n=1 Tax=Collybiopsis luxurians FD-317 M1 TaxID=944289 RepID=A0A0D0C4U9_9AGAR|nr:hypothetical protein GYMLUDRAFT_100573 [Collybiopsis luxurians FD-317 M1]